MTITIIFIIIPLTIVISIIIIIILITVTDHKSSSTQSRTAQLQQNFTRCMQQHTVGRCEGKCQLSNTCLTQKFHRQMTCRVYASVKSIEIFLNNDNIAIFFIYIQVVFSVSELLLSTKDLLTPRLLLYIPNYVVRIPQW